MNQAEYERLGFSIPECLVGIIGGHNDLWFVTVVKGSSIHCGSMRSPSRPSQADVLHHLLYHESNHATLKLRDFVEGYDGLQCQAVAEWVRVRRQRRVLRKMFPKECP